MNLGVRLLTKNAKAAVSSATSKKAEEGWEGNAREKTRKKYQYCHICNWYMISSSCHDPVRPRIKHGSCQNTISPRKWLFTMWLFLFSFFSSFIFFSLLFFSFPHCRVLIAGTMMTGEGIQQLGSAKLC